MERDSFIFYKSFYEAIVEADPKIQNEVFNAICKKALYEEDSELTGVSKMLYTLIKPQLEANTKRYEDGKKGGRPKKETTGLKEIKTTGYENEKPNKNENDNENENDNDNDNDNNIPASEETSTASAKASKRKYGEYKHVMLKDEELQKLQKDYENWEELIKYLDEYIEMKGYKAKNHYLCIKKWVVNAVKEEKQRQNKQNNSNIANKKDFSVVEDF